LRIALSGFADISDTHIKFEKPIQVEVNLRKIYIPLVGK